MSIKSLDLSNKRVLIRLDLNVPMSRGQVTDTTRITRSLETVKYLIDQNAKIIILSHFGRPQNHDFAFSMRPIATAFSECLGQEITFVPDCIGDVAKSVIDHSKPGDVLMLENVRFYGGEEENDPKFAHALATLGDIYINDAFSCSHRAHASVVGITRFLPSYPGFALKKEVEALKSLLTNPKRPLMAIVGGSKVSTKLELLLNLVEKADYLVIGGGMANTFLKAQGHDVGKSLVELSLIESATNIMKEAERNECTLILPTDGCMTDTLSLGATTRICSIEDIKKTEMIADIGPETVSSITDALQKCKTVVWNGPVGVFEIAPFHESSVAIAKAISEKSDLMSVAGGGDTLACIEIAGYTKTFSYLSTAGGAFLEWLEGKELPGIKALDESSDSHYG